jgi:hypothetical protein
MLRLYCVCATLVRLKPRPPMREAQVLAGPMIRAALGSMLGPGETVDNLEIQISGRIQNSNFPVWKNALLNQIGLINLKLITDNDFAAATEDAKLLKRAEKAILEAKIRAIEQTEEIQLLFNALDDISEQARQARLTLERQIRTRKQEIRTEIQIKCGEG